MEMKKLSKIKYLGLIYDNKLNLIGNIRKYHIEHFNHLNKDIF